MWLYFVCIHSQFEEVSSNKQHLKHVLTASTGASQRVMRKPRKFSKPCVQSALAIAMTTPVAIATHIPVLSVVAACVGRKDIQQKIVCPSIVGGGDDVTNGKGGAGGVVRYHRSEDEQDECDGVRRRGKRRGRRRRGWREEEWEVDGEDEVEYEQDEWDVEEGM